MKINQLVYVFSLLAGLLLLPEAGRAQVKIGNNYTTIGSNSNLEVEATNGKKVIVNKADGTLIYENAPTSTTNTMLLTVDGNGLVSKQMPTVQDTPVMLSVTANTSQSIPANGFVVINYTNKLFDKGNNFDLSTDRININSDGYYSINIAASNAANLMAVTARYGQRFLLYKNGSLYRSGPASIVLGNDGYTASFTTLVYAKAGDYFQAMAYSDALVSYLGLCYLDVYKVSN